MLPQRIADKIDAEGDCWIWTAASQPPYNHGRCWWDGNMRPAHRVVWEILVGPPPSLLDHLCRNPPCVNPDHLRAATPKENAANGAVGKYDRGPTCKWGHPLDGDNLYLWKGKYRKCRACNLRRNRKYREGREGE